MGATKFWKINGTGSYMPVSNTRIAIRGNIGSTGLTGVIASTISEINAIGATSVKIYELGINVASATGNTVVFSETNTTMVGSTGANLTYYNNTKPAFGIDGPITSIIPVVSNHSSLSIRDANGNTATFASNVLGKGVVYPFNIDFVNAVTANEFIGLAEY
jgi:hypothetical protein